MTDLAELKRRIKKAHEKHSLREIGRWADVSFETLRKLIHSPNGTSLTFNSYNKIDEGLKKNGF